MTGAFVDTNYFLRFLLGEESDQSRIVYDTFKQAARGKITLFTSIIVFFEINWVLASTYQQDKSSIITHLQKILAISFLEIAERELLETTVQLFTRSSVELEDCYNLTYAKTRPNSRFLTFDKKLQRLLP